MCNVKNSASKRREFRETSSNIILVESCRNESDAAEQVSMTDDSLPHDPTESDSSSKPEIVE